MSEEKDEKVPCCTSGDWCPLSGTANVLSKKWHPVIIHRLLEADDGMGFNYLKEEIGNISSKVLSESLSDLEDSDIVVREVISEKPFRVKYDLTDRGKDLEQAINAMVKWGEDHLKEPSSDSC